MSPDSPQPPRTDANESQPSGLVELTLDPRRLIRTIFIVCVVAEVSFLLLDYHVNYARLTEIGAIRRLFNATREDGLASWFGVTQTFMVALTVWLLLITARRQAAPRWRLICWLLLALFFTYMAVDDGAELHERMGTAFETVHDRGSEGDEVTPGARLLESFPSYAWQVVFLPFFAAAGLFMLAFLWYELGDWHARILVGLAVSCFILAVGLDFIEGLNADHRWNLYSHLEDTFDLNEFAQRRFLTTPYRALRHFSKSIEECIEMLGMTILWVVLLGHWMRTTGRFHLSFASKETS